uniref:Ribosome biogenesis protein BMS1/TSR1 C-terminal domain-containing protein n=2 Tax=Eutreptiella gymnastica TaxID=73025 RepID=A0A7S1NNU2_9EUGL
MATVKLRKVHWRDELPYMVGGSVKWQERPDGEEPLLEVSGYLRGRPLCANNLAHLSHLGTFQIHSINGPPDPCPVHRQGNDMEGLGELLDAADEQAEPLTWVKDVDPMANEQTWPTDEELGPAPGDGVGGDSDEDDVPMAIPYENDDAVSTKSRKSIYTEIQTQIDSLMATDIRRLENMTEEEREAERKHYEAQRRQNLGLAGEDREFPDEVDAPWNIPARQRFLRYRGLASMRTSKWDPYENLPPDYARIFQFQNIKTTQKRAWMAFDDMPVPPDRYITIALKGVPRAQFDASYATLKARNGFVTLSGLRKHEHKWSVMHYNLQFSKQYSQPVKSKESVLMHVGFRIMRCNPIYSEPSMKADKHKLMRYYHPEDKFAVASCFAPISYAPMPVLMFKTPELDAPTADLVAYGNVMGADPNRVILKKVVLTGSPYRIHKKQTVVRFMFYNEKDVNWFKPVELFTKLGQSGRIKTPIGTHGYMKCQMSGTLRAEDTICMALYKRVFPKWTTIPCSWLPEVEGKFRVPSLEDHGPVQEDLEDSLTPSMSAVQ